MISESERLNWNNINAIRVLVSTLSVIFGISGLGHGFFEMLQGSIPTNGPVILAIGQADRFWELGNEPAFTLLPTFLITGIASILTSLAVIIWSIGFIQKKSGPTIFLLLFIVLFLVGGGIGQVIFFTIAWAFATRINKPLIWWQKVLPQSVRKSFKKAWLPLLSISAFLIIAALEIAIFGFVPGITDPDSISLFMLFSLGSGLLFMILAFVSSAAHNIERKAA